MFQKGAGVSEVTSWNLDSLLTSIDGCTTKSLPQKNCFFYFSLFTNNGSTLIGPDNFYFPEPLKSVNGPANANIKVGLLLVCTTYKSVMGQNLLHAQFIDCFLETNND